MNRREMLCLAAAGVCWGREERLKVLGRDAVKRTVEMKASKGQRIRVDVPLKLDLTNAIWPMKDGVAKTGHTTGAYEFCGKHDLTNAASLAIPMVYLPDSKIAIITDPYFTAAFDAKGLHWIYPADWGVPAGEKRSVYTVQRINNLNEAMDAFYATALSDVPKGPDWLHDIAMVGYDYLSENGKGWFADIDALEKLIAKEDRSKVALCLHGWYDWVGRYSYDARSGRLDRKWTAFGSAFDPEYLKRAEATNFSSPWHWDAKDVRALRPTEMTLEDMHRRIAYAKTRGFRVALYFADGTTSCDGIDGFVSSKVLRWGGWTGPETKGKSYAMNPAHPEVTQFFKGYLAALLKEYGHEIDALVWDETFIVQAEDGWAGRAMMELVRDLTKMTTAHRKELAFLASDDVGIVPRYKAPYALVAHGTYQDSSCDKRSWPFGIFPNFRNTIWSCNWAPTKAIDRTRYAVEVFDVPVAISNGYGEDRGMSELSEEKRAMLIDLFNKRKNTRMELTWIEERNGSKTYKGRNV